MIKIWSSQGFDSILLGQQYSIFSIPLHCTSTNHKSSSKYETNCLCPTTTVNHQTNSPPPSYDTPNTVSIVLIIVSRKRVTSLSKGYRFASIWFFLLLFVHPSFWGLPPQLPHQKISWPLLIEARHGTLFHRSTRHSLLTATSLLLGWHNSDAYLLSWATQMLPSVSLLVIGRFIFFLTLNNDKHTLHSL